MAGTNFFSFPEPVTKGHIIKTDFLGDPEVDIKKWIARGSLPAVDSYLRLRTVQQVDGPWIALDGFTVQEDETRGRRLFCCIRSFLIANRDVALFLSYLSRQDFGGRWLPEKPKVFYTFAGEIPWCDTFPKNGPSEFSFVSKEELVKTKKTQKEFYLDEKKLESPQIQMIRRRIFGDKPGEIDGRQHISNDDLERVEVREVPVEVEEEKRTFVSFNALIPVCDFGWEGHQTAASLAKEITSHLEPISNSDKPLVRAP